MNESWENITCIPYGNHSIHIIRIPLIFFFIAWMATRILHQQEEEEGQQKTMLAQDKEGHHVRPIETTQIVHQRGSEEVLTDQLCT